MRATGSPVTFLLVLVIGIAIRILFDQRWLGVYGSLAWVPVTGTKFRKAPCLFENTQTRKKLGLLTTVLTFSPSHCKFAGWKAEPPFLLARQVLWEMTARLTAREGLVTEQRPPVPLLLSRMFRRLPG